MVAKGKPRGMKPPTSVSGDQQRHKVVQRTALITGSSSGLGRAMAERLARDGCTVGINGRNLDRVKRTVRELRALSYQAFPVPGDVSQATDVDRMIQAAIDATGSIDILVNNAGGTAGIQTSPNFEELSEDAWHAVVNRNLTGTFLCCRAAVPHMKARRWGRIINIASESARIPIVPRNAGLAYAAAKSGILGFSRVLAAYLAPFAITVNVVAPGFTRSERAEASYAALPEERLRERVRPIKLGRWAEPLEIASAISYLASEDASYCVGAILDVNGGSFMP